MFGVEVSGPHWEKFRGVELWFERSQFRSMRSVICHLLTVRIQWNSSLIL